MSANAAAAAAGGAHHVYLPPGAIAAQQAAADSKIPGEEYEEIREQVRFFPLISLVYLTILLEYMICA